LVSTESASLGNLGETAKNLFSNVLLVRKTPKYFRLKDSEEIQHPYVKDVLLENW
jgi:hypothetical protein